MDGVNKLLAAGVTKLVIDLHNNTGGFICLGAFLYIMIAGTKLGGYACVGLHPDRWDAYTVGAVDSNRRCARALLRRRS